MKLLPVLVGVLLAAPALASVEGEDGHWEYLGEDGAVWVPHHPVAAALPPPGLGAFHDHAELSAALETLAAAFPSLVALENIGTSVEGRAIWKITLRAGPEDGRPAVLFDGAHHGDEVIGSEILLRYAQALVAEYPSTSRSRDILDNATVVIVPMVNPDGVARAHTATDYAIARKNARGVDLNRNYAGTWGGPGASSSPSDATYRGPSPASEPETQAIQQLMASRNWTFYSSLHSGAEMILWPLGHTTAPPPEEGVYLRLGDELSALTNAPDGQVSRILYQVSGDSMDHAYIASHTHWKPLSTSPETFEGVGNAFDWWPLFNPADANIPAVVARWTPFLDHLAREARHYAPPTLTPPPAHVGPGAPFDVATTLVSPLKRPLLAGTATATLPGFLEAASANPIVGGPLNGTRSYTWTLSPRSGGEAIVPIKLYAGFAGNITTSFPVDITAPALSLTLDKTSVGSGATFTATLAATSDTPLVGTATLLWQGNAIDTRAVALDGTDAFSWSVPIDVGAAPAGSQAVTATLDYVANGEPGLVRSSASVFVDRPQLTLTRTYPADTTVGSSFVMTVVVRNTGTMSARDVRLVEVVPEGYVLWPRSVGVPIPADPLARPAPSRLNVTDGQTRVEWDVVGISAGGAYSYQLGLMPLVPGEHALATSVGYRAEYAARSYAYDERREDAQGVALA